MRISPLIPTALSILMLISGGLMTADAQVSIFRLQALNDSGVSEGTCFVIRQEARADGTYLVLVTSARLFERESGRYTFDFRVGNTAMFTNVQYLIGFGLYGDASKPQSWKDQVEEEGELFTAPMVFLGWRF